MALVIMAIILGGCQQKTVPAIEGTGEVNDGEITVQPLEPLVDEEAYEPPKKQTKSECLEQWKLFAEKQNSLINLEENKIGITFIKGTTLSEAITLLETYNIEKEEIVEIFPFVQEKRSEEEIFNANRRIKGVVKKDKGIDIACVLLQEQSIESASPSIVVDIMKKLAEAAQQ